MNNQVEPNTENDKPRSWAYALIVLLAIMLLAKLFDWIRGNDTLDEVLQPAVFLLLGLTYGFRLKGVAQRVLLAVSAILVIIMLVLLFSSWV